MMSCTYRPISTVSVNITPPARKTAANVATRLRSLNEFERHDGVRRRCARRRGTRSGRPAPPRPNPTVNGDSQPCSGPIEKPNTAAVQPSVARMAPVASSFSRSRWVSRNVLRARWIISRPIGTLTRNAHRQDTSVSAPPTIEAHHRADTGHRGEHRRRGVAGRALGERRRDQRQTRSARRSPRRRPAAVGR